MSEVKRWNVESDEQDGPCSLWNVESAEGEFVEYEDYAALKAERDALTALTAPPVKLPRIEVCDLYATPYQKGVEAGATQLREEFIRNIRAAGYQVEGE